MANAIPRPGPAKLTPNAGLDEWLEEAKQCHYLPERAMKELCEMVKEVLMEGMSSPYQCQSRKAHHKDGTTTTGTPGRVLAQKSSELT